MLKVISVAAVAYALLQLFGAVIMFFAGFDFTFPNDPSTDTGEGYYFLYTLIQFAIHFFLIPFTTLLLSLED